MPPFSPKFHEVVRCLTKEAGNIFGERRPSIVLKLASCRSTSLSRPESLKYARSLPVDWYVPRLPLHLFIRFSHRGRFSIGRDWYRDAILEIESRSYSYKSLLFLFTIAVVVVFETAKSFDRYLSLVKNIIVRASFFLSSCSLKIGFLFAVWTFTVSLIVEKDGISRLERFSFSIRKLSIQLRYCNLQCKLFSIKR